ncbi:hypothetical protein ASPCAL10214 [Aspergillus calidoustus]|uniref:Uncharacterized protein n=1 Tax=Aspergillus calidoustus TaxID=454130 RepID=A0A0U5CC13_ASPCI|nr:hypothetical protein ASPCAL10214 [Aspergillus calidoustus]
MRVLKRARAKAGSKGCCPRDSDRRTARKAPDGGRPRLTRTPSTSNTFQYCPVTRETAKRKAGDQLGRGSPLVTPCFAGPVRKVDIGHDFRSHNFRICDSDLDIRWGSFEMPAVWYSGAGCEPPAQRAVTPDCPRDALARTRMTVCTQTWVTTILIAPHKMTPSPQSGLLAASTLAPQSQHELARRDLVMGLVQAWSARSPGREVCALSGTRLRALADSQPSVPSVPDQEGRINQRRVTSVPRVPDPRVGLAQSRSRGGASAPVSSAPPSGRLRCQRCGGTRSRTYHCRHFRDPIASPAIGVCSRRRTGCADANTPKERNAGSSDTMERSVAELPGWGRA